MAVRDPGGCRRQSGPQKSNAVPELPAAPAVQPVMRRWPHPVAVHPAPEGLSISVDQHFPDRLFVNKLEISRNPL